MDLSVLILCNKKYGIFLVCLFLGVETVQLYHSACAFTFFGFQGYKEVWKQQCWWHWVQSRSEERSQLVTGEQVCCATGLRMVFSLLENMFAALCGWARLAVVQKRKPTIGATVLSSLVSCFLLLSFYILGIVAKLLYSFVKFSVVVFSLSNGIISLCPVQNAVGQGREGGAAELVGLSQNDECLGRLWF